MNAPPGPWIVVTVHGIRTFGAWQHRLEQLIATHASEHRIEVLHYRYGFFLALAFWFPLTRWLAVRRFRSHLIAIARDKQPQRIHLVGHSFGTYLICKGLLHTADAQLPVHTVLLAGSVLRCWFPWRRLTSLGVQRIINDCGDNDMPLLFSQLFTPGTGMAGRAGLNGMVGGNCCNRYFPFGHSGYFIEAGRPSDSFLTKYWLPLLTTEDPAEIVDCRRSPSVRATVTALAQYFEPVSFLSWAVPLFALGVWGLGWYQTRQNVWAGRLAEGADDSAISANDSHWLALASWLVSPSPRALGAIARNQPILSHREDSFTTSDSLTLGSPVIAFSDDGRYVLLNRLLSKDTSELAAVPVSRDGGARRSFKHTGGRRSFAFSEDMIAGKGMTAAFVSRPVRRQGRTLGGVVRVIDMQSAESLFVAPISQHTAVTLSRSGHYLALSDTGSKAEVRIAHLASGRIYRAPRVHGTTVAFSADDSLVAVGDARARITLLNRRGEIVSTITPSLFRAYHGVPAGKQVGVTQVEFGACRDCVAVQVFVSGENVMDWHIDIVDIAKREVLWSWTTNGYERIARGSLTDSTVVTYTGDRASMWNWRNFYEVTRVSAPMLDARYDADAGVIRVLAPSAIDSWAPRYAEPLRTVSSSFSPQGFRIDPNTGQGVLAAATRDGTRIAITSVWDETFEELKPLPFRTRVFAPSPSGSLVALWRTSDEDRVCIYATDVGNCVFDAPSNYSNPGVDAWFVDNPRVFAYRDEYDVVRVVRRVRQRADTMRRQVYSGHEELLPWSESCERDAELSGGDAIVLPLPESDDAQVLGFSANATEIYALETDYESEPSRSVLVRWRLTDGCRKESLNLPYEVTQHALSADGSYLATVYSDSVGTSSVGAIALRKQPWSARIVRRSPLILKGDAVAVAISNDGEYVAAYDAVVGTGHLRVWDLAAARWIVSLQYSDPPIFAFGSDARLNVLESESNGSRSWLASYVWEKTAVGILACKAIHSNIEKESWPQILKGVKQPNLLRQCKSLLDAR